MTILNCAKTTRKLNKGHNIQLFKLVKKILKNPISLLHFHVNEEHLRQISGLQHIQRGFTRVSIRGLKLNGAAGKKKLGSICATNYLSKSLAPTDTPTTMRHREKLTHYYYVKITFRWPFPNTAQRKIRRHTQQLCKKFDIKLVFPPTCIK